MTNRGDLCPPFHQAAFAFRGYNIANLGRTPELLAHPAYGPIVAAHLRQAAEIFEATLKRPTDLVTRVREGRETRGLVDYAEDIALIVAVEIAHLRLLEEFFGVSVKQGRYTFGHSLGEVGALIASGVYRFADFLPVPLIMADDCARLAEGVSLSILFSRGPVLDFDTVRRLCLEVSQRGQGVVDISTYLSPNSVLLIGQNGSLGDLEARIREVFGRQVALRRHQHRFPPLHTPIMWQSNIPNRTALILQTTPGGFTAPTPPVLSMVTGEASYGEFNSRDLMHQWVDHPQRLWEIVYKLLSENIGTVIHVGPAPNLLPATFRRLSNNLAAQMQGRGLSSLGRRTISRLVRRPWLTRLLPSNAVLFRSLFVEHVILEDWLLDKKP